MEQVRVFDGAVLTAVYLPYEEAGELRLAHAAGGDVARYGLPERCPLSGPGPVAEALRTGRPQWQPEPALATLPLVAGGQPKPVGTLAVVERDARNGDGIGPIRRVVLEMYAGHVAELLEVGAGQQPGERAAKALDAAGVGWFVGDMVTGRFEADAATLELNGIDPQTFDGRGETMIAHTVAEDLPALMALIEPEPWTLPPKPRQLDFRTRTTTGEHRWLRMRAQVIPDAHGTPARLAGVLAEASRMRPGGGGTARLQRLSATLAGARTVGGVGEVAIDALRGLGADHVVLAGLEGDRLVVAAFHPQEPTAWPEAWRGALPSAGIPPLPALKAVLRGVRVRLWDAGEVLEAGLAGLASIGPEGLALVPLHADGRVRGVCLAGWDVPREARPDERILLTAIGGLVGHAAERARATEAQHELASTLQRSLLPRTLPVLPGGVAIARYLPATVGLDLGGDWYDVIPLSDRHVAFVIGDVQGHSAGAATIMGQIRTAIRAYAVEGHSPDVVISHANRLLAGMQTDLFATCCYVAMDMEEGEAWLVRAGHLPPLVRDPDGSTREIFVEGGPPLGVAADAEFPMSTLGLVPGSVLTLLTDGLVESPSLPLEDGLRRVRGLLAKADPADAALLADTLLGGVERRDDDVALLVLRYDGTAIKPRRASWAVWRLPEAVGHARRFTARTLQAWDVSEGTDAALLVVSELVTNALVHTRGEVRLDITLAGDRLRVAVSDSSPRTPVKAASGDWEATGGRGILLVEAVSEAWGSVPLSGGKQVWGEIALAPSEDGTGKDGQDGLHPLSI